MAKDINLNLKAISDALPQLIDEALEKSCQQIENKAKEECLVDTGTLRRSITHEIDTEEHSGTIGTNVEYAEIVEEKFKPFLQIAFDSCQSEVLKNFEGLLERS